MAELPEDVVAALRDMVARRGVRCLEVSDLQEDDLDGLAWAGSPLHLHHVAEELRRAARGEADYLAVRSPSGVPVAKGGVNYAHPRGPTSRRPHHPVLHIQVGGSPHQRSTLRSWRVVTREKPS